MTDLPAQRARAIVEALPDRALLAEAVLRAVTAVVERKDGAHPWPADIELEQSGTELGNVRDLLVSGPETAEGRILLATLLMIALRDAEPATEPQSWVPKLSWLAANTRVDPFMALDACLEHQAAPYWRDLAGRVGDREVELAERVAGAVALRRSQHDAARDCIAELLATVTAPPLLSTLELSLEPMPEPELCGELGPRPRAAWKTALLGLTGALFVMRVTTGLGRVALALRRPTRLSLSERGIEWYQQTRLLGRVLREREVVVPWDNLASVTREVRYARAGLYAGLASLTLGTLMGMSLLVDGVRAPGGSPSLIAWGLGLILGGIALDFITSTALDSARGRCRVVVTPRVGEPVAISQLAQTPTDAWLRDVMVRASARRAPDAGESAPSSDA